MYSFTNTNKQTCKQDTNIFNTCIQSHKHYTWAHSSIPVNANILAYIFVYIAYVHAGTHAYTTHYTCMRFGHWAWRIVLLVFLCLRIGHLDEFTAEQVNYPLALIKCCHNTALGRWQFFSQRRNVVTLTDIPLRRSGSQRSIPLSLWTANKGLELI